MASAQNKPCSARSLEGTSTHARHREARGTIATLHEGTARCATLRQWGGAIHLCLLLGTPCLHSLSHLSALSCLQSRLALLRLHISRLHPTGHSVDDGERRYAERGEAGGLHEDDEPVPSAQDSTQPLVSLFGGGSR